MNRNYGINFKYPRSSGGKFFQQKIDEGRSGLSQVFGLFPATTASSDVYFRWNEIDTTQFSTGFFVDGSSQANLGSASFAMATSSNAAFTPGLKLEMNNIFSSSNSSPYLIPINTGPLPARYTVRLETSRNEGTINWGVGFCFGAVSASANSADLYGNIYMFASASNRVGVHVIQSGSSSIGMAGPSSEKFPGALQDLSIIQLNIEMFSTVGNTSGSLWRIDQEMGRGGDDVSNSYFSSYNPAALSGAYADWSAVSSLNSLYLVLMAPSGGVNRRSMRIDTLAVFKHPYDRAGGGVLT